MGFSTRKIDLRYPNRIQFPDTSKKDVDAYFLVGRPAELFGAVAKISGRTPLFPKWAMGFTNSQWGADKAWDDLKNGNGQLVGMTEEKFRDIIGQYRENNIPIDAFTFDLDWMFWGGAYSNARKVSDSQFKWNIERFPGMKPDAPKTAETNLRMFAEEKGIKLTAILKPRIPFYSVEGSVAERKGYWMPYTEVKKDYFTETMMRHVDFSKPEVRKWYWEKVKGASDTGIQGWWNDEADSSDATDDGNETEGTDMQRAVYEGQRASSDLRVWSINRNFYLGAQRYAYTLWSGDIDNGFASMKVQRQRMLSAINAGATQWTMDTGGFHDREENGNKIGTQNEDYARWMQFAIFTPIFRVHGENAVQRQPWYYKPNDQPLNEMAAVQAIRLRYKLIPYIYSYEHQRNRTGVGIVRPLLFDWPEDDNVANNVDSWLFGDWLLASPVVEQ
ncbi:glycoside hydrolase family 31 protein, partial [Phyllobacterium sp. P5_D12]